jgi:tetraacyldisaccharide 4'-kinase
MSRPERPLLLPLVPAYRLALAARTLSLRAGFEQFRRLTRPVISIGSLSAGGAGKTPLTIALAKLLVSQGFHVDVLSRGYRRKDSKPARVRPDGSAEEFGDEPLLIARETGLPVYVAAQRYDAGLLAEKDEQPDRSRRAVHLLDDGFQHRQLARDIDIVLVSRSDSREGLLPAGNLREPLGAALRASVAAIPADEPEVESSLRELGWKGIVWRLRRTMRVPSVEGPIAAFCGIARAEQFFHGLESAGLNVGLRATFRDHHPYTIRDLTRLLSSARDVGAAALITTEKDCVRLAPLAGLLSDSLPILFARLQVEIEDEAGALQWLESHLKQASKRLSL